MMKKTITAALLACAAAGAAAEELHYNVVHFNESVSAKVANDTMTVALSVQERAKSRQAASNSVTQKLNRLNAALKRNPALEAELSDRRAAPVYDDKGNISGWEDYARLQVRSLDFDALNTLIAAVQQDAAVEGVSFAASPKRRAAAVDDVSAQVLAAVQQRAASISRSMGFDGRYRVVSLRLNQGFDYQDEEGAAGAYALASPAPALRMAKSADAMQDTLPGSSQIRQTVSASVQLY